MATTDFISFSMVDYLGKTDTLPIFIPSGGTRAELQAFSDVAAAVGYSFDAQNTVYRHTARVPGHLDSLLVGESADTNNAAVQAFRDMMVVGDGTLTPSDKWANDLIALLTAVLSFRK